MLLVLVGVICCVGLWCLSCVGCCAVRRPLMAAGCVLCCLFLVASPLFASTLIFVCRGLSRGRLSKTEIQRSGGVHRNSTFWRGAPKFNV